MKDIFHALSYRWISAVHPDPQRFHLEMIGPIAEAKLQELERWENIFGPLDKGFRAAVQKPDFALLWDFGSLYQPNRVKGTDDRTPEQRQLFNKALSKGGALNLWYDHRYGNTWMQTAVPPNFSNEMAAKGLAQTYKDSGWCFTEWTISSLLRSGKQVLDLDLPHPTVSE